MDDLDNDYLNLLNYSISDEFNNLNKTDGTVSTLIKKYNQNIQKSTNTINGAQQPSVDQTYDDSQKGVPYFSDIIEQTTSDAPQNLPKKTTNAAVSFPQNSDTLTQRTNTTPQRTNTTPQRINTLPQRINALQNNINSQNKNVQSKRDRPLNSSSYSINRNTPMKNLNNVKKNSMFSYFSDKINSAMFLTNTDKNTYITIAQEILKSGKNLTKLQSSKLLTQINNLL